MIHLLLASSIGVAILLAWVGWGSLLNTVLAREPALDWGQRAAWGVAVLTIAGGVFEMLGVVSRPLVLVLIAGGVLLWLVHALLRRPWRTVRPERALAVIGTHKIATAIGIVVVLIIGARFVGHVQTRFFNPHDDYQAYLVFPVRMLDTGHMGVDPFNHTRLMAGLGGKYFLDTFSLGTGSAYNLHLVDAVLGLVVVA
ncbi:MAG: hypothetical protein ACYTGP_11065, partial [Planctomycetota bacterium]